MAVRGCSSSRGRRGVIDLLSMFDAVLNGMTQTQADDFDAIGHLDQHAENAAVKLDRTHLNDRGKKVFGRIVADQLVRTRVEVGPMSLE